MSVQAIHCGSPVNLSEELALERFTTALQALGDTERWVVLANPASPSSLPRQFNGSVAGGMPAFAALLPNSVAKTELAPGNLNVQARGAGYSEPALESCVDHCYACN